MYPPQPKLFLKKDFQRNSKFFGWIIDLCPEHYLSVITKDKSFKVDIFRQILTTLNLMTWIEDCLQDP